MAVVLVIPAKAGIQFDLLCCTNLDPGLRRGDSITYPPNRRAITTSATAIIAAITRARGFALWTPSACDCVMNREGLVVDWGLRFEGRMPGAGGLFSNAVKESLVIGRTRAT